MLDLRQGDFADAYMRSGSNRSYTGWLEEQLREHIRLQGEELEKLAHSVIPGGKYHVPQWIKDISRITVHDPEVLKLVTWKMLKKYIRKHWRKYTIKRPPGRAFFYIDREYEEFLISPTFGTGAFRDEAHRISDFLTGECKHRKINQIELLSELLNYV